MKKMILASMVVVATIFTGCEVSSSEDEKVTSCDMNSAFWEISRHLCIESKEQSYISNYCREEMADIKDADQEDQASAVTGTGCSGGAKKTCDNMLLDGVPITIYAYDESSAKDACEQLLSSL